MEFSEIEKQILIAIKLISRGNRPDRRMLDKSKKKIFGDDLLEWDDVIDQLIEKGNILEIDGKISISDETESGTEGIYYEWLAGGFDEWLIRSDQSRTYSEFCYRLYGRDLCQCSMISENQLQSLIKAVNLNDEMKALDIGCGIGRITEYLSDVTRVNLTGIDIAAKAIEQAIERTANKQYRLTFEVQNIDNIKFPTNSFDSIISFDSLYFAYDLNATINRLKEIIKTGGTMGFTYSQKINPDEPTDNLLPYKTKLALALCNENLNYTYIDYSDEEYEFWKRSKSIAEELKSDFEKEGFPDLYESRISESEVMLEAIDQDRLRRFHYYVNC